MAFVFSRSSARQCHDQRALTTGVELIAFNCACKDNPLVHFLEREKY